MRRYETIFILRPNVGEEEINRIIGYTTDIITDEKGSIIEINKWGLKKLAYLIKKESLGFYVYCDYAGTPAAVAEIERKFRIDDSVMKYMTVKTAETIDAEEIEQALAALSEKQALAAEAAADEEGEEVETADESELE
ncbi:30S ribosomal protein S6 [Desulforhopalus singaporensis]|uniref:Small ribosomal subunit protein bS6 n=1 Tax=Desulforhopalus singaporensis TaxID=91360 RepID=A0A1H0PGR6_9BACT|nr:30S ribosomal protein S6 [Desulforhopalus singaporensis]SDP03848.1 SSU ribosomal protein S6P [Desulforhopalus singaporensis]